MPKKHVAGLAMSAIAILLVAACQAYTPATVGVPERATVNSAGEKLAEAVARTRTVNLRLAFRIGSDSLAGGHDSKGRAAAFSHHEGMAFVTTADTMYVKDVPGVPAGVWARMDVARIAASCQLAGAADPIFGLSLVLAATSTEQTGDLSYSGRSDLSRVTGSTATMKTAESFAALATRNGSAIPFTARTNSAGYVVSVTATLATEFGDLSYDLSLSDFGAATKVSIPTDAVEAPPELYL